jgi:hypothetical protein
MAPPPQRQARTPAPPADTSNRHSAKPSSSITCRWTGSRSEFHLENPPPRQQIRPVDRRRHRHRPDRRRVQIPVERHPTAPAGVVAMAPRGCNSAALSAPGAAGQPARKPVSSNRRRRHPARTGRPPPPPPASGASAPSPRASASARETRLRRRRYRRTRNFARPYEPRR